jgi:hypothetical protein
MALVMPYMCDAEKTSAVMVFCEAKGFGGDDDVELLWEPWRKGLLDRFEGLVLLGLGLPAMSSFVVTVLRRRSWGQRDAAGRDQRSEQRRTDGGLEPKASGLAPADAAWGSNSCETPWCARRKLPAHANRRAPGAMARRARQLSEGWRWLAARKAMRDSTEMFATGGAWTGPDMRPRNEDGSCDR